MVLDGATKCDDDAHRANATNSCARCNLLQLLLLLLRLLLLLQQAPGGFLEGGYNMGLKCCWVEGLGLRWVEFEVQGGGFRVIRE